MTEAAAKRNILWIDGVGAWLVCLPSSVTFGQAGDAAGPVDVPLLADVSRIHATLTREEEGYLLESTRDTAVNGQTITRTILRPGDEIRLGSCRLRFTLPVPGCLTATLTMENGRRLPYAVDGIVLMADMVVMGDGSAVHVPLPAVAPPVYLVRQKDRLGLRWQGPFTIDGVEQRDRAALPDQARVSGPDFSFALEPLRKPDARSTPGSR